jgi:hypothetical protein
MIPHGLAFPVGCPMDNPFIDAVRVGHAGWKGPAGG